MSEIYDVIILGAGPAGLAAGLYAGRSRLNVLIIEKGQDGGQIAITDEIENYPGQIVEGESGPSLIARMTEQAEKFGAKRVSDMIKEVELEGEVKVLKSEKNEYRGKNVIIATGAHARPIGCKGEGQFRGKGVSYCATCDGAFFKENDVAVVGGGNTALEDAIFLSNYCKHVYLINRTENFKAEKSLLDSFKQKNNTEIITSANIKKLVGKEKLEKIELDNGKILNISGLFIAIGQIPNCNFDIIEKENGFIKSNEECTTNIPGIFVAGDIRNKSVRQIVTSVSDGAVAAINAVKYIEKI